MNYAEEARRAALAAFEAESEYYRSTIGGDDIPPPYDHIVAQLAIIASWLKVQSLAWLHDQMMDQPIDDLEQP